MTDLPQASRAIADCYHAAAMAGADMRRTTGTLESFRELLGSPARRMDAWRAVDDAVGSAFGRPEFPALLGVRRWFVESFTEESLLQVRDEAGRDPEKGWRAWVGALAVSAAHGRYDLYRVIAGAAVTLGTGHSDDEAVLRRTGGYPVVERWIESGPAFELLASQEFVPPTWRARLWRLVGQIELYLHQRRDTAREHFERAYALAPGDAIVLVGLGEFESRDGRIGEARKRGETALRIDGALPEACCLLADCAKLEEDLDKAEYWYNEAIRRAPGSSVGYTGLCELPKTLSRRPGSEGSPEDLTDRVAVLDPTAKAGSLQIVARAFEQQGELEQAEKWCLLAIAADKERADSHVAAGYLALSRRDRGRALEYFSHAVEKEPDSHAGPMAIAMMLESEAEWAQAETWFRRAARARPEVAMALLPRAAHMAWKAGRREEGYQELVELLRANPEEQSVVTELEAIAAETAATQKDEEGARRQYATIRELVGPRYEGRYHNRLGNLFQTRGDRMGAIEAHRRAMVAAPEERGFREALALALNAQANEHYARNEFAEATSLYREAAGHMPDNAVIHSNFAGALERDTTRGDPFELASLAAAEMREAVRLDPGRDGYRRSLRRLETLAGAGAVYGKAAVERLPLVTPIAVEIGADLIPLVEGEGGALSPAMAAAVKSMRASVAENYGVQLPGVRVRGNKTDMPPTHYLIMLGEVPLVIQGVKTGWVFALAPVESLPEAADGAEVGTDPATGAEGAWVPPGVRTGLEARGVACLSEVEFMVRHVMAMCERNLVEFVGTEEVHGLVTDHASEAARGAIMNTPDGLRRLTAVVLGLLAERVPIRRFDVISERFRELNEGSRDLVEIIEGIRCTPGIRESLECNRRETRWLALADDFRAMMERSIVRERPLPLLAMEPETCKEALAAVRTSVGDQRSVGVLAEDGAVRHFMRKLVELEWPELCVHSRAEVVLRPDDRIVGTIRMKER